MEELTAMLSNNEFNRRQREIVSTLKQLVEIESPTSDKAGVDRVGTIVAQELNRLGASVITDPQPSTGNHIIGHWPSKGPDSSLLFLCHMDTVHPLGTLERNPCVERDGKLFGPGVLDMKAGIAILLWAFRILQAEHLWPNRPITALFTSDEETGSMTSRPLIEQLAGEAALTLCLEPCLPDGSLKTWRKGVGHLHIAVHGRAAHAGAEHALGRNAIEELAHQVLFLQGLTDHEKGTTVNVGVIRGGTVSNVVPSEASAEVDVRVMSHAEAERIFVQATNLKPILEGISIDVFGGLNRPPMPRDQRMVDTFQKAQRIAQELGLAVGEGGTGGGSDANFVAPLGVPVLDGLGVLGEGQHSEREHIILTSLPERAALLAALLTKW